MNILSSDDYSERLDKHIKDEFKKVIKPTHPCEHQNKNCLKGSSCPLIGLPNDTCTYYLAGKCKHGETCKQKHNDKFASVYQKAKIDFKKQESHPLAMIHRFWRRFAPFIMGLFGIIFNYLIRRILDSGAKRFI